MNTIQGFGSSQNMMSMMGMGAQRPIQQELSDDQKETVKSILSKYDSENFTTSDAQSIFKELSEAGITPGKGLKETIEEAGFDAEKLRAEGMSENQASAGMQMMGMGMMPPPPPMTQVGQTELTDDQKSTISDILSEYDSENVTAADAKAIFQKFSDAGITPAKGMKEAIEAAGFDADNLRDLAMPEQEADQGTFWAQQDGIKSFNTANLQSLQSILNQYDLSNLSSDQENTLFSELFNSGLLQTGSYFNIGA